MKSPDGNTESSWRHAVKIDQCPPLSKSVETDVCVVGAGIAGLTTAYLLAKRGKKVAVVDAGPIGDGQTARTSAHLASALDDRFVEIEKAFGSDGARLAYESHAGAIDEIERISKAEKIDCDFARVDGYLFLGRDQKPSFIDNELHAAQRAGFTSATKLDRAPLPDFDTGPCIRFPKQAQFHPLKYLVGLSRAVQKQGVKIFCGTRIVDVQGTDEKNKRRAFAKTGNNRAIHADAVVVATNTPAPINDWLGIYLKQMAYRSYVVALPIAAGSVKPALYWDTEDPYHYVRVQPDGDSELLLVGGADHRTGQQPEKGGRFVELIEWARKRFPVEGDAVYQWSGQVQEPADGLGYLGRAPTANPDVYVITGDSGMGLTHSTIGAMLITDLIEGKSNPWEKLYDPSRKPTGALLALESVAAENTNTVAKYVELITPGDVKSADDIPINSGAVLREGLHKIAVYKDHAGRLHRHSAVCTHLGCIVAWNQIEGTWDCPCHGARYDPKGKVILGPAIEDLKAVD
ncbi:MAG: FAD-dependent oxidoreductase [Phycisphaerae bacterium]|nr:FAD-dependent oxidoreductase [Phycisphaerae bacterium]